MRAKSNQKKAVVNRNTPYVVLMDAENVSLDDIKNSEDQIRCRRLFVSERRAYERNNHPITGERRELLLSLGYRFVDIGSTNAKNAVDTAIKAAAWGCFERYQKHLILISCDGGFSSTINDLTRSGVKVFLPKLKRASTKLKSIRSLSENYDNVTWRSASSHNLVGAIEKLRHSLGRITQEVKCSYHEPEQQQKFEGVIEAMRANPVLCVDGWIYPDRLHAILSTSGDLLQLIKVHLKTRKGFVVHESSAKNNLIVGSVDNAGTEPMELRAQKLKVASRIARMYEDRLPRPSKTNKLIKRALYEISIADENTRMFLDMFDVDGEAANLVAYAISFDEAEMEEFIFRQTRPMLIEKFNKARKYRKDKEEGKAAGPAVSWPIVHNEVKKICKAQAKGSGKHLAALTLHPDFERMCQVVEEMFFEHHPKYRAQAEQSHRHTSRSEAA